MKFCSRSLLVGLSIGILMLPGLSMVPAYADGAPNLVFREIKISGDEFVVIENAGTDATPTLDHYWLGYTSNDKAAPAPSQQLPAGVVLQPGQTILLTNGTTQTCDAAVVAKLSAASSGLSDTSGTLSLWQADDTSFTLLPVTVRWSKTAGDDINLTDEKPVADPVWYKDAADAAAAWRVGDLQPDCTLALAATATLSPDSVVWPQGTGNPPAIIEALDDSNGSSGPFLPAGDAGLLPPQITELLPNPAGTGTDGTDEFIELYNPNSKPFDLGGFTLETGLNTKHKYVFSAGTSLPPSGFTAFYSADTGLSLSNTSGAADLLDPFGTQIAVTDQYGSAKDGQAWALAKGEWYWTGKPTPGAANVINQTAGIATTTAKKAAAAVKGAATTAKTALQGAAAATADAEDIDKPAPLHPYLLAAVAAAAVGYGIYEYRHDLGNRFAQFRADRSARRKTGA